nr:retrovirus-related Pol polyprotein from transposon TNT 1-94 [Ipomoea batatas]
MRSIAKLPEVVHSSIRSGIVLYDLTRVMEELVCWCITASMLVLTSCKGLIPVDLSTRFPFLWVLGPAMLQWWTMEVAKSNSSSSLKGTDPELWSRVDAIVLQWIYGTISEDLHTIIERDSTAELAWNMLEDIFLDNKNSRALYLEQEFFCNSDGAISRCFFLLPTSKNASKSIIQRWCSYIKQQSARNFGKHRGVVELAALVHVVTTLVAAVASVFAAATPQIAVAEGAINNLTVGA